MKMAGTIAMVVIIAVAAGVGVYFLMGGTDSGPSDDTVTFTSDNGTPDHTSIKVKDGTTWNQPDSGSTLLFSDGQKVLVMPKEGYKFTSWSQPSGVVKSNLTLTAKCEEIKKDEYKVTFAVGSGKGTVSESLVVKKGITFGANGNTILFSDGQTASATPAEGYDFNVWNPSNGTITADTTISATFVEKKATTHSVSFKISGKGITPSTLTVNDGTTFTSSGNSMSFSDGQKVTAEPAADYEFGSWNPSSGTVTKDTVITITYNAKGATDFTVTISAGTGGTVDKSTLTVKKDVTWSSSGTTLTFSDGQKVTATASSGYEFEAWSPASGTVAGNVTISASFTGGGGEEKTISFLFCDNFENDAFESTTVYPTYFYPIIPSLWIHGKGTDMASALTDACANFDGATISISDGKITDINGVKDGCIYLWGWKDNQWADKNSSGQFLSLGDLTITDYDNVAVVHGIPDDSGTAPKPSSEPGRASWYYGENGGPAGTGKEVKFYVDVNFTYTGYEGDTSKTHSDPKTLLVPGIWIKGYASPGSLVMEAFTNAMDRIGYDYNVDKGFVNWVNECSGGNFLQTIWDPSTGDWYQDTGIHHFTADYVDTVDFAALTYGAWGGETGYDIPPWPDAGASDYKWGY